MSIVASNQLKIRATVNGITQNDDSRIRLMDQDNCVFSICDVDGCIIDYNDCKFLNWSIVYEFINNGKKYERNYNEFCKNNGLELKVTHFLSGKQFINEDINLSDFPYDDVCGYSRNATLKCSLYYKGIYYELYQNLYFDVLLKNPEINIVNVSKKTDESDVYDVELELTSGTMTGGAFLLKYAWYDNLGLPYVTMPVDETLSLPCRLSFEDVYPDELWCFSNENDYGTSYTNWMRIITNNIITSLDESHLSINVKENSVSVSSNSKIKELNIFNSMGTLVCHKQNFNCFEICLKKGIYIYYVIDRDNKVKSKKIIL